MYNLEEVLKMYKEEITRLHSEINDCLCLLEEKTPHCVPNVLKILNHSICCSSENFKFIESFEQIKNLKQIKPHIKLTVKPQIKKCVEPIVESIVEPIVESIVEPIVEKCIRENVKTFGTFIKFESKLQYDEISAIESFCLCKSDKRIYEFVDKCAVYSVLKWLKKFDYDIDEDGSMKNNNNIIVVKDKKTLRQKIIKVLSSGMKFQGKTKQFSSSEKTNFVPLQYTYLIDPKEIIYDSYVFVNCCSKNKLTNVYARIKGEHIQKMLVDPIRERFIGKMACILQKEGYNKGVGVPFSVDELLTRR